MKNDVINRTIHTNTITGVGVEICDGEMKQVQLGPVTYVGKMDRDDAFNILRDEYDTQAILSIHYTTEINVYSIPLDTFIEHATLIKSTTEEGS